MSFGANVTPKATFGYSLGRRRWNLSTVESIIRSTHQRLAGVYVFREDFETLIKRSDRPETFFYCDPPYYGVGDCYEHDLCQEDHERLASVRGSIKGKFLLSYNDSDVVRSLYSWASIEPVETKYTLPKKHGETGAGAAHQQLLTMCHFVSLMP